MIRAFLARSVARWVAAKYDTLADKLEEIAPDPVYEPTTLGAACRKNIEPIREAAEKLRRAADPAAVRR